ncbi:MAG: NAD(P)H-dependent oxidoreductase [Flavobacteriaceae bacterium]|nr:NAD(P)H-dependent oxidoreductase [Bacteroidia bacterium]MBT8287554.1 NAD(P)H-dependent oxidoreductase [Bacteroidia bacterium]NNF74940.1 NAD(P)H-dependent oxidoreductase [Flavobacteriaceae bacterium]
MKIIKALKWRYATKKFDNDKFVSKKKLNRLKKAFNLTATSYGLQPIKLMVIKDKELQQNLVQHSMNQQQVAQASHVLIFCIEIGIDENYVTEYFDRVRAIRNTPDEILKPFEDYLTDDIGKRSQDFLEEWATKQAYLAMGNLLTVCALEKIDACPMEGFDPLAYDKILGLPEKGLKSVLAMPVGYRAKDDIQAGFKKVRKTVAESTLEL